MECNEMAPAVMSAYIVIYIQEEILQITLNVFKSFQEHEHNDSDDEQNFINYIYTRIII